MPFPNTLDTFSGTTAQGTSLLATSPDHAGDHRLIGSNLFGLTRFLGVSGGTNVFSGYQAGWFPLAIAGGTPQIGLAHGTYTNSTLNGGTLSGALTNTGTISGGVYGTSIMQGGSVNNATLGTPTLTGSIVSTGTFNQVNIGPNFAISAGTNGYKIQVGRGTFSQNGGTNSTGSISFSQNFSGTTGLTVMLTIDATTGPNSSNGLIQLSNNAPGTTGLSYNYTLFSGTFTNAQTYAFYYMAFGLA